MDRFCGRKTELDKLGRIFARIENGGAATVVVSGPAGAGKTALVSRFAAKAENQGALFGYGKADAASRNSPFAAVAAAMEMLVNKAIADTPHDGGGLKQTVRQGLGPHPGQLATLLTLVPALAHLVEDPGSRSRRRGQTQAPSANLALLSLLEALSAALKRPLVLFLDDLQWMDAASHGFLRFLAISAGVKRFLVVAAHRGEAPDGGAELGQTTRLYESLDTTLCLPLGGLTKRDTRTWLARRLDANQDLIPLADLCREKTAGNPLYLTRLLNDLLERGVVFRRQGKWAYDITHIAELAVSTNVADLIIRRIRLLAEACLALLRQAACIQGEIGVQHLMATSGYPRERVETLLWKPVQEDLLRKTDNGFTFAHDKILEAVEALLDEEEAGEIHRRLVDFHLAAERRGDPAANPFTLLYHYGLCGAASFDPAVRREMAGVYFKAGEKAHGQSAYELALAYFHRGKAHYPGDIWEGDYDLALRFCQGIARCAYLAGDFEAADRVFAEVDAQAKTACDRRPTELVKIARYQAGHQEAEALATGLAMLRRLGVPISEAPSRPAILMAILKAWGRFVFSRKERLMKKRLDPDSDVYKVVHCLSAIGAIAYYLSPERLLPLVTAKAFELSVKHGNMAETPVCYISFGMMLNQITGGIQWGRRLGAMAREIGQKFGDDRHKVKEMTLGNVFLDHWDKSMAQSIDDFQAAESFCLRQGDHEYYGYNALGALHCRLIGGHPLDRVAQEIAQRKRVFERINNRFALTTASFIQQAVANLVQGVPRPWVLDGDHFREARLGGGVSGVAAELCMYKFSVAVYCGRADKAAEIGEGLKTCDEMAIDAYQYHYHQFLSALVDIDLRKGAKQIRGHLKRLKKFAARNGAVYGSKYLLVQAECLAKRGDTRAVDLYRQAAAAAAEQEFRFEEALAWEGLGRLTREGGDQTTGDAYLARAVELYTGWGLQWKTGLFNAGIEKDPAPQAVTTVPGIPMAGQTEAHGPLSDRNHEQGRETVADAVLDRLQRISGAATVHAAVRQAHSWKSWAYIDGQGVHRPATFVPLPERMLNLATATDEIVRADADCRQTPFFDTAYYCQQRPSSLMAVPAGKDRGLYFENFTHPLPEADLRRLAQRLFARLDPPDAETPQTAGARRPATTLQQRNCARIQAHMRDKAPFRDPKLNLAGVAGELGLSQRAVTEAINTQLGQNFRTFVNSYRVEAVKTAMEDPASRDQTILEIAFAQGFNSKSTFNEIFKQFVGTTPTVFRARHGAPKEEV